MKNQEFFRFECPTCRAVLNAAYVAAALPEEVLRVEVARRNGRRQTPHAGPGRPAEPHCPACGATMTSPELRDHRPECVRSRLEGLQKENYEVHLYPKDPDPYPNFKISSFTGDKVTFHKLSSGQDLDVELQKIADITRQSGGKIADIQLRGRVVVEWVGNRARWVFMSKAAALLRHNP